MGLGTTPLGSSAFGFSDPDAPALPAKYAGEARFIDPLTGQHYSNGTGGFASMPQVRQQVELAFGTAFRSSTAVPTLGINIPSHITKQGVSLLEQRLRNAVQKLVSDGKLRIEAVNISSVGSAFSADITYTDLTTLKQERLRYG